ncbi:hypothetical protein F511_42352 [Dorcoceras hygrometricum]|uniref:Uncharacterized protein n=1 Tax=Dorcoceras hygrometricum TaxID=472368 RepID=A0A2Z7AKS1_9LAMI|nr:hypothetical protein F511_42352 [Dorcoceras hygrometricum]
MDLIWYNLVDLHLREAVFEHWKNFHKDKPSANQDIMAIHKEHPAPEKQMLGSMMDRIPRKRTSLKGVQPNLVQAMVTLGAFWCTMRIAWTIFCPYSDPSLSLSPSFNLGPSPSNLQMVVYTANREVNKRPANEDREVSSQIGPQPISLPNNQITESTAKKATSLEGNVSSLVLKVECIRDNADFTRRSTVKLQQQLKTTFDGLEIKIDLLESTLFHLVDEVTTLKSQVAEMVECLKACVMPKMGKEDQAENRGKDRAMKRYVGQRKTSSGFSGALVVDKPVRIETKSVEIISVQKSRKQLFIVEQKDHSGSDKWYNKPAGVRYNKPAGRPVK